MLKVFAFVAAVCVLSVGASAPAHAEGGCNRIGETGYHYYNFCLGPWFLYAQNAPAADADGRPAMGRRHHHHHHRTY